MLDLGLDGKVAIITGGSDGLGRAAAERLAREGARVAICGRRKEHLEQAADGIRKATGGQILAQVADVSRMRTSRLSSRPPSRSSAGSTSSSTTRVSRPRAGSRP
jgi:NAD(P)-dependent dehydrogenase (short-subunit alcohol dehydrogenase family)